jgi:hypothetical protein
MNEYLIELATLGAELGTVEAFPMLIAYDAATLGEVGREAGYHMAADLKNTVDGWRTKVK